MILSISVTIFFPIYLYFMFYLQHDIFDTYGSHTHILVISLCLVWSIIRTNTFHRSCSWMKRLWHLNWISFWGFHFSHMLSVLLTFYLMAVGVVFAVYLQRMNSGTVPKQYICFVYIFVTNLAMLHSGRVSTPASNNFDMNWCVPFCIIFLTMLKVS